MVSERFILGLVGGLLGGLVLALLFGFGETYDVDGAGSTFRTRAQYRLHQQNVCQGGADANKPCATNGDCASNSCAQQLQPFIYESGGNLPIAWLETSGNGAGWVTSTLSGGQRALLFGGFSGSIFAATGGSDSVWFGINLDSNTAQLTGCGGSGTGGYIMKVFGGTKQIVFGKDLNACTYGAQGARVTITNSVASEIALRVHGVSGQSTQYFQVDDGGSNRLLDINSSGETCVNCGGAAQTGRLEVHESSPNAEVLKLVTDFNPPLTRVTRQQSFASSGAGNFILAVIPIPTDTVVQMEVTATARCTGTCTTVGTGGVGTTVGRYRNIGGTVTRIGSDVNTVPWAQDTNVAIGQFTLDISTNTVRSFVSVPSAIDLTWHVTTVLTY